MTKSVADYEHSTKGKVARGIVGVLTFGLSHGIEKLIRKFHTEPLKVKEFCENASHIHSILTDAVDFEKTSARINLTDNRKISFQQVNNEVTGEYNVIISDDMGQAVVSGTLSDIVKNLEDEFTNHPAHYYDFRSNSPPINNKIDKKTNFKGAQIHNRVFRDCTINLNHFSAAELKNVLFENCQFTNTSFSSAKLTDCIFRNCNLDSVMFTGAEISNTSFNKCEIDHSSFEDARLNNALFYNSSLHGSHFLEAEISNSKMTLCKLENTILFQKYDKDELFIDKESKRTLTITKPTCAFLVDPENPGISGPKMNIKLKDKVSVTPLRISFKPNKADAGELISEVECNIQKNNKNNTGDSTLKKLIDAIKENPTENKNATKIVHKSSILAQKVNCICLPGGEDIPPKLYGEEEQDMTAWGGDYRRSVLEAALLDHAINKGIPLIGVCRGFQMTNVFLGAKLNQHVSGQKGIQTFELPTEAKGLLGKNMPHRISSPVFHHQAVPLETTANHHIEPIIIYDGMVKGAQVKYPVAAPMVLTQFHPEFLNTASTEKTKKRAIAMRALNTQISSFNDEFFKAIMDASCTHFNRQSLNAQFKNMHNRV